MKSAPDSPLKAFWPDGRRVQPGRDAKDFLDAAAVRFGEKPAWIQRSVARDAPAGRMILAMLGLTREAVIPPHRPADTPRARLIMSVVEALLDAGRTEAEAFAQAPKYLANPELRARTHTGHGQGEVLGKGKKLLTAAAVCQAYRTAREFGLTAKLWFIAADETGESVIRSAD